jgi:hypothetical protein
MIAEDHTPQGTSLSILGYMYLGTLVSKTEALATSQAQSRYMYVCTHAYPSPRNCNCTLNQEPASPCSTKIF